MTFLGHFRFCHHSEECIHQKPLEKPEAGHPVYQDLISDLLVVINQIFPLFDQKGRR